MSSDSQCLVSERGGCLLAGPQAATFPKVQRVSLVDAQWATDQTLREIGVAMPALTDIDISGCQGTTPFFFNSAYKTTLTESGDPNYNVVTL